MRLMLQSLWSSSVRHSAAPVCDNAANQCCTMSTALDAGEFRCNVRNRSLQRMPYNLWSSSVHISVTSVSDLVYIVYK